MGSEELYNESPVVKFSSSPRLPNIVYLDVGGTHYTVSIATLQRSPTLVQHIKSRCNNTNYNNFNNSLNSTFNSSSNSSYHNNSNSRLFLDANGRMFEHI